MIYEAVIYSHDTGQVTKEIRATLDTIAMNLQAGEGFIIGAYDSRLTKVDVTASPHAVVTKTEQLQIGIANTTFSADGTEGLQLSGIEDGTVAVMPNGTQVEMLPEFGGELEVLVDLAGDHSVTLKHPLYLDTTVEFTAT